MFLRHQRKRRRPDLSQIAPSDFHRGFLTGFGPPAVASVAVFASENACSAKGSRSLRQSPLRTQRRQISRSVSIAESRFTEFQSKRKTSDEIGGFAVLIGIGMARFELTTFRTPSERATRLRYIPFRRISSLRNEITFVKLSICAGMSSVRSVGGA